MAECNAKWVVPGKQNLDYHVVVIGLKTHAPTHHITKNLLYATVLDSEP